jgi:hypothetical protein
MGLEPTLMASFQYNYLPKSHFSKYSLTPKYQELPLPHQNFEGTQFSP